MKALKRIILPLLVCTCTPAPAQTADTVTPSAVTEDMDRIETYVRNGFIHIVTPRAVTVRLYTILGQLITQQTLQPGTSRIKTPGRGVYILRTGTATRRINV